MARIGLGVLFGVLGLAVAQTLESVEPVIDVSFPAGDSLELRGQLYQPNGGGPFPAVVLMHRCDGMLANMTPMEKVALMLRDSGYVVLVVDSFGPRGVRNVCDDPVLVKSPNPRDRVEDALVANRYLSSLKFVDSSRVGLVGWAHGGITALMTWARNSDASGGSPFAAIAAYYPLCGVMGIDIRSSNTPLLIFIGDRDDVVSASGCQSFR